MKETPRPQAIAVIKSMLKRRLNAKGMFNFNDKWLTETAEQIVDESKDKMMTLEPDDKDKDILKWPNR